MDIKAGNCVIFEARPCSASSHYQELFPDCRCLSEVRTAPACRGISLVNPEVLGDDKMIVSTERYKEQLVESAKYRDFARDRIAELEEQLETLRNNVLLPGVCYAAWLSCEGWSPTEILKELDVSSLDDLRKGGVDEYDIEQLSGLFDDDGNLV